MQLQRPSHPRQAHLQFLDPSQAELWTSLSREQQQTCQELLSQLLRQIMRSAIEVDQKAGRESES